MANRELERALTETHEKVGHTGQGLWHHKGMQLPAYLTFNMSPTI